MQGLPGGIEERTYDVVVVGAGGAGIRAAIEAQRHGARTALVCKSLFGKAHTVMAEGGIAAALRNVWKEDGWEVHFRDTMRGGKLLSNWRMAQIHAQEAPDRVLELEEWGAMFDRTKDGLILQRDFGGHRYARLAHVGDRTGLEMIRTLQNKAVELGIDVLMECTVQRLLMDDGTVAGCFGYWRQTGAFVLLRAKAIVLATGGAGKAWRITSNSWEYTGDGMSLALDAGADLIDMEFVQFHPTGMVWPQSVRGILVTEGVRGDGGTLRNREGERFMFRYVPEFFRAETADTEAEADRWYDDKRSNRRTPDLLPRDEVARAINAEVKAGRGSPHGGVFLDIATRRPADYIKQRLPSMYHQFKELADIDITTEAMEVGPTCHYFMGGVRVDADTAAATVPGLFAAGEVAAGLHGANRLGGNSLSDLLVFGRRAGASAADHASKRRAPGAVDRSEVQAEARRMVEPFERRVGEDPYAIHADLQDTMQSLVGIIRSQSELDEALVRIAALRERHARVAVWGSRRYNPGWHLALDLGPMLTVSETVARAAALRTESRGGHTREDFPKTDPEWGRRNVVTRRRDGRLDLVTEPLPEMPDELRAIVGEEPKPTEVTAIEATAPAGVGR
jgi:succinate dehydrogenase / fumarate reductase flavoprotein subunit